MKLPVENVLFESLPSLHVRQSARVCSSESTSPLRFSSGCRPLDSDHTLAADPSNAQSLGQHHLRPFRSP